MDAWSSCWVGEGSSLECSFLQADFAYGEKRACTTMVITALCQWGGQRNKNQDDGEAEEDEEEHEEEEGQRTREISHEDDDTRKGMGNRSTKRAR